MGLSGRVKAPQGLVIGRPLDVSNKKNVPHLTQHCGWSPFRRPGDATRRRNARRPGLADQTGRRRTDYQHSSDQRSLLEVCIHAEETALSTDLFPPTTYNG